MLEKVYSNKMKDSRERSASGDKSRSFVGLPNRNSDLETGSPFDAPDNKYGSPKRTDHRLLQGRLSAMNQDPAGELTILEMDDSRSSDALGADNDY